MRKEGRSEGRLKVAEAARRLLAISKEMEGTEGSEVVCFLNSSLILSSSRQGLTRNTWFVFAVKLLSPSKGASDYRKVLRTV